MIQSHILNIIFKLVKPDEFNDFSIVNAEFGQYGNGIDIGYVKDLGHFSDTETYANIKLKTKNHTFHLITGKRFNKKYSSIILDNKTIVINDEINPYVAILKDFLTNVNNNFATIDNSISTWKITEQILKSKNSLLYYPENYPLEKFIENHYSF
jgi:glucose-6-phosphate 1-dehydrogenase